MTDRWGRRIAWGVIGLLAPVLVMSLGAPAKARTASRATTTERSRRLVEGYARLRTTRPEEAWRRYLSPNIIQHDPDFADGSKAHTQFLAKRRLAHPGQYLPADQYANVIDNIFADGDLVAIKSHLFTNPQDHGRVFVDIWRVAGGKFVEHWDVIQPAPEAPVNDTPMWCGTAASYAAARTQGDTAAHPTCGPAGPASDRAASLATVTAYQALGDQPGKQAEAVSKFVSDDIIQHTPGIPKGKAALEDYFNQRWLSGRGKGRVSHMARVIADGDFVLTHRRVTAPDNPRGTAFVDLYRVRDGQVVEHWDVVQPIPPYSASGHSMVIGPLEPDRVVGGPEALAAH